MLRLFTGAVQSVGLPSHVRSDRGGENVGIARLMLQLRGPGRHITGKSVHNQSVYGVMFFNRVYVYSIAFFIA